IPWANTMEGLLEQADQWNKSLAAGGTSYQEWAKAMAIINDKLVELVKNGDNAVMWLTGFNTTMETHDITLQPSLTVLGEHTKEYYQAMAEAAQKAFAYINDSSRHMAEVWINKVLPAMKAAYGEFSAEVIAATNRMVSTLNGALAYLGVQTDSEL